MVERYNPNPYFSEIGFLLSTKGKYTPGGEFDPDQWYAVVYHFLLCVRSDLLRRKPILVTPPRPREPAPTPMPEPEEPKPTWRNPEPKKTRRPQVTPEPVAPVTAPAPEHPTSWVSWKRTYLVISVWPWIIFLIVHFRNCSESTPCPDSSTKRKRAECYNSRTKPRIVWA